LQNEDKASSTSSELVVRRTMKWASAQAVDEEHHPAQEIEMSSIIVTNPIAAPVLRK